MRDIYMTGYEDFECIADRCTFTCCAGWDIHIDEETQKRWREHSCLDMAAIISNDSVAKIDKDVYDACPFLREDGLCNMVTRYGEEELCHTCHTFPRIKNEYADSNEYTLSQACETAVECTVNKPWDMDKFINGNVSVRDNILIYMGNSKTFSSLEFAICNLMLNTGDWSDNARSQYMEIISGLKKDIKMSIEEVNELFLDVIDNYRDVPIHMHILSELYDTAEHMNYEQIEDIYEEFEREAVVYEELFRRCFLSKIVSECTQDDINEIRKSFQNIYFEYIFIRYALFLKFYKNRKISKEGIISIIASISRIVTSNAQAFMEFIYDCYDDYLLESEYLIFISI